MCALFVRVRAARRVSASHTHARPSHGCRYFAAVPQSDRLSYLDRVEDVLRSNFRPHDLVYDTTDISWRHVGLYQLPDGSVGVVLLDLGGLRRRDTNEHATYKAYIDEHIQQLKARA